jgi:hexosaminidase
MVLIRNLFLADKRIYGPEQIQRYRTVQYMMWPRSLAVAECLWSPKDKKNWNDFANRVQNQFPRMDAAGIRYARSYTILLSR